MTESSKLSGILPYLFDICFKAGREILAVYESPFEVESKGDRSPLTIADKRSHEIINAGLQKITFDGRVLPVLSEEGREISYEERSRWEFFWLVDPLDGTKEFIKRNGEFTINIALIWMTVPILGFIHVPVTGTTYFAVKGMGAYRSDSQRIDNVDDIFRCSNRLPCENSTRPLTVVGSRSHMSEETMNFMERIEIDHGEIEVISAGSSLKFCLVAEGRADIYPRFAPTMEWDSAAGQVIVEEAKGAIVRADNGRALEYNKKDLVNPWFIAMNSGMLREGGYFSC